MGSNIRKDDEELHDLKCEVGELAETRLGEMFPEQIEEKGMVWRWGWGSSLGLLHLCKEI